MSVRSCQDSHYKVQLDSLHLALSTHGWAGVRSDPVHNACLLCSNSLLSEAHLHTDRIPPKLAMKSEKCPWQWSFFTTVCHHLHHSKCHTGYPVFGQTQVKDYFWTHLYIAGQIAPQCSCVWFLSPIFSCGHTLIIWARSVIWARSRVGCTSDFL